MFVSTITVTDTNINSVSSDAELVLPHRKYYTGTELDYASESIAFVLQLELFTDNFKCKLTFYQEMFNSNGDEC